LFSYSFVKVYARESGGVDCKTAVKMKRIAKMKKLNTVIQQIVPNAYFSTPLFIIAAISRMLFTMYKRRLLFIQIIKPIGR